MKKIQILLICVILISVIFIAGCTSTSTQDNVKDTNVILKHTVTFTNDKEQLTIITNELTKTAEVFVDYYGRELNSFNNNPGKEQLEVYAAVLSDVYLNSEKLNSLIEGMEWNTVRYIITTEQGKSEQPTSMDSPIDMTQYKITKFTFSAMVDGSHLSKVTTA